jgi:hypothetical protein
MYKSLHQKCELNWAVTWSNWQETHRKTLVQGKQLSKWQIIKNHRLCPCYIYIKEIHVFLVLTFSVYIVPHCWCHIIAGLELVGDSGEIVAEFRLTSPTSYMKAKMKSPVNNMLCVFALFTLAAGKRDCHASQSTRNVINPFVYQHVIKV